MSAPAFSIVVPVHDGARWLRESIDSGLGQTREDWQLIVVDEGRVDLRRMADRYLWCRLAALRLRPAQPVDLLCLLIALARFHPAFITRWVGRLSG